MFSPTDDRSRSCTRRPRDQRSNVNLQEILQSLRLVLEMEPDHLDGAIDLLEEAIALDRRKSAAGLPRQMS